MRPALATTGRRPHAESPLLPANSGKRLADTTQRHVELKITKSYQPKSAQQASKKVSDKVASGRLPHHVTLLLAVRTCRLPRLLPGQLAIEINLAILVIFLWATDVDLVPRRIRVGGYFLRSRCIGLICVFQSERGERINRSAFWRMVAQAATAPGCRIKPYAHLLRHSCFLAVQPRHIAMS